MEVGQTGQIDEYGCSGG